MSCNEEIEDEELQKLCDEGEKYGVSGIIKDIWTTALDHQRMEFSHDQASNREFILIVYLYLSGFMQVMVEEIIIITIRIG